MKKTFFLIIVLLFQTQISEAGNDRNCRKAFCRDLTSCIISLKNLRPNTRAAALRACVQEAKDDKQACMSGPNLCLDACQTAYTGNVAFCEQAYDPSLCGSNTSCQQIVLQQQNECVSAAVVTLDSCTTSCPQ